MRHSGWRGLYAALEGIDGAGTTTHAQIAAKALNAMGVCVKLIRQPGSRLVEPAIRELLRTNVERQEVLALLFAADRVLVETEAYEYLRRGCLVLADRSVVSSLVYQTVHGEPEIEWVYTVNRYALLPDVVIYIDVDPEVAAARIARRRGVREGFERLSMLRLLATNYHRVLRLLKEIGVTIAVVRAVRNGREEPIEIVARRVIAHLLAAWKAKTRHV